MDIRTPTPVNTTAGTTQSSSLQYFVFALFFIFGGITSLNDVLIPKLKELFTLSYGQAMLVQSAFFGAFFVVSLPAAAIVKRFGYLRTATIGLLTMAVGCLLFAPASVSGLFGVFLAALFVLAGGITIVQVVANPLISMLGRPQTAHSRLTFAQAFNSVGTTIFPYVGSALILGSLAKIDIKTLGDGALKAYRAAETQVVSHTYVGLAIAIAIVAAAVWFQRGKLAEAPAEDTSLLKAFELLRRPRFAWGAACIFLYVGAEVSVGSIIVNYLMQSTVLGMAQQAAGKHVAFYWGGAMVGRFIGAYLLRLYSPGKILAVVAATAIGLLLLSANTTGWVSGWSLLAIGLFNSVMFPTIFALACEGLGPRSAEGSGIMCMAIVGGAVVPLITGHAADGVGLKVALAVPAVCYAIILAFGVYTRRAAPDAATGPSVA